ncbi:uncharacterized protein HMPREF1541_02221 [Cyphellophora europaea CBS 101466]|uniref:DUF8004 domain-containing protein n=1 Tax=Cyphellophora europaea (strain CBS 101466) TaxID=1220924 RepID=W2S4U3_CYPE1|nr:uncharacterized protein HMPREF1541_02221 [Cyphellophora europaea CBS 101466]ETN43063.1 hypothetical protein HMPREF1541_02221 [Cyphellophora europaea CBS 101466]
MSKRLSSIFSMSKDDHGRDPMQHSPLPRNTSSPALVPPPVPGKLHKAATSQTPNQTTFPEPTLPVTPLAPPPLLTGDGMVRPPSAAGSGSRPGSQASVRSRPQTPTFTITPVEGSPIGPTTPTSTSKLSKRSSWLPGGKSPTAKTKGGAKHSQAWIAGLPDHVPYDLTPLVKGERVLDLWNDQADTVLYLFPKSSRRGPSFRIDSALLEDSNALKLLRLESAVSPRLSPHPHPDFASLSLHDNGHGYYRGTQESYAPPSVNNYAQDEAHIHLPLEFDGDLSTPDSIPKGDDLELLVLYRNFFAFLQGGALVATPRQSNLYAVFMGISSILKRFRFSNADGSTWGDVTTHSFARYCQELRLADVRSSREKTVEALVLGEHMRFWALYNEGFVHAAGRLEDIKRIKSPKYAQISPITCNRLERSSLDIEQRLLVIRGKLEDFDFPSMFSGVANSQVATEAKLVRFKAWKLAFADFRKFTLSYYRRKYGAWPPKAKSKKNTFEESGLNRRLLQEVYQDFTDLYDMLADRHNLTTRASDVALLDENSKADDVNETLQHALRRVESEYDRATPPVIPPIPFDVPTIPGFKSSFNRVHALTSKSAGSLKRLKDNEVNEILLGSYNREHISTNVFIQDFFSYERKLNQGKTMDEIVDNRCGQWLFMYAVLQSLPIMVVDARDVQYRDGVEYFLCMAPRGGRPWMKEDTSQSRSWYNVSSGGGVVSLPADLIDHSVEGIYRRSHCWDIATKWAKDLGITPADDTNSILSGLGPPPSMSATHGGPSSMSNQSSPTGSPLLRPSSGTDGGRLSTLSSRSSVNIGLEAVPQPPERQRPTSVFNPNITFDQILSGPPADEKKKKGKK